MGIYSSNNHGIETTSVVLKWQKQTHTNKSVRYLPSILVIARRHR